MGAFGDVSITDMNMNMNEEQMLLSTDDHLNKRGIRTSPQGVEHFENGSGNADGNGNGNADTDADANDTCPKNVNSNSNSPRKYPNGTSTGNSNSNGNPSTFSNLKLDMPNYNMIPGLRLALTQPVLDRCSLYSVIHDVNKEVQDMASNDENVLEENKDTGSALVQAVNGPIPTHKKSTPRVELAVLDEEKFLLAAIASRTEEEVLIRHCPQSFAYAIGERETDTLTVSDDGTHSGSIHSDNPLSVVSASRTQLWKPSRSWWEAKSGKNPWIEPTLHNKRWR